MYNPGLELLLDRVMKTRSGRFVVATLAFATTTALLLILGPVQVDQFRLAADHRAAPARVTDSKIIPHSDFFTSDKYQLKYELAVAGQTYTRARPFGEAWSELPKQDWNRATFARVMDVIYLPADPAVNCPAIEGTRLRLWAGVWSAVLVVLTTVTWWWTSRVIRDTFRLRAARQPPRDF